MKNKEWAIIIAVVLVVAVAVSLITANITGNVVNVPTTSATSQVYTKSDIDNLLNGAIQVSGRKVMLSPIIVNGSNYLRSNYASFGMGYTTINVVCSSGQVAISGGCRVQGNLADVSLLENHPTFSNKQSWTCGAFNRVNTSQTIEAYTYCV